MSITEILNPKTPAGAYEALRARAVPLTRAQPHWKPEDGPMPALFISHGAPPTLDDAQWLDELFAWAQSMPKPRAIVIVSAHWENAPLAITGARAGTPLYYDFGGFHPRYYTLKYPTPDATELGRRITATLSDITVHEHRDRGLDHGAFIPLMAMYPDGDVPIVQLSMPSLDPASLFTVGERLRELRAEGILVIGSGFMTHSFAAMRGPGLQGHIEAFDEWAVDALDRTDVDALIDFEVKAPSARVAHPTTDHFVPLLLTLGAATAGQKPKTVIDRIWLGNSIRSLQVR